MTESTTTKRIAPVPLLIGLVHEIGEVRTGKPGGHRGDIVEIYVFGAFNLLDVNLKDLDTSRLIWSVDQYLAIEAPRA